MLRSHIEYSNGIPYVSINNELHYPLAYTSYFEECGEFSDFIKSGYRMFFINVSFSDLPINNGTGFSPFLTGVFEDEAPDYSEFDSRVREILTICPEALIFPRINIAMPRKWIRENKDECVETPSGMRESLYSDKFLRDGRELLLTLVSHIRNSTYSHSVAGYQLCGGTTQEWFHHDLSGSFSKKSIGKFRLWMEERYDAHDVPEFIKEDFVREEFRENVNRFGEFSCEMAAKTAEYFSKVLKEYIYGEQIVGIFYGYNVFLNDVLWGHHGLRFIVDSPYIDFFSSPCGYDDGRRLGIDWSDMLPTASLKAHNKLYFVECDIRTYLTRRMQDARPGKYPEDIYLQIDSGGNKTVWSGPETKVLSLSVIRKSFVHQLTKGSGIWWFDMWGGWFHDDDIMNELQNMKIIAESSRNKSADLFPKAETVVFIDEKAYFGSTICHSVNIIRSNMGNTGIPFDFCMVEDAEKVIDKYKAAIFTAPVSSNTGENAKILCKSVKLPYMETSPVKPYFTGKELSEFLIASGVHCYNSDGNVIYSGNGYLGVHTVKDGNVKISLPDKYKIRPLFGTDFTSDETDYFEIYLDKHETAVFELI